MPAKALRDASALVTGGSGFIGSHVVRRLLSEGVRVTCLGRSALPGARLSDAATAVRWIRCDLTSRSDVAAAMQATRPDFVFHLAGFAKGRTADAARRSQLLFESYDTNLLGTLNLCSAVLDAAPDLRRVVRFGSLEEYGDGPVPYLEEQREAPVSPYSSSHVAATHLCSMLHKRTGLPVVSLRPALTYGPDQDESFFIPGLIAACLAGEPFAMTTGEQTRDFLYVSDLVDACIAAATAPAADEEILNIGAGIEHRIADVARLVASLAGADPGLCVTSGSTRERGLERLVCNPDRAFRAIGWRARVTLEEGLAATIHWTRMNRAPQPVCRESTNV